MRSENIDCLTCALVVITVLVAQTVSQQRSVNKDVVCTGSGVSPNSGSPRENCSVFLIFTSYKDIMEPLQRNLFLVTCIIVILGPHVDGGDGGPTSRKGESQCTVWYVNPTIHVFCAQGLLVSTLKGSIKICSEFHSSKYHLCSWKLFRGRWDLQVMLKRIICHYNLIKYLTYILRLFNWRTINPIVFL